MVGGKIPVEFIHYSANELIPSKNMLPPKIFTGGRRRRHTRTRTRTRTRRRTRTRTRTRRRRRRRRIQRGGGVNVGMGFRTYKGEPLTHYKAGRVVVPPDLADTAEGNMIAGMLTKKN